MNMILAQLIEMKKASRQLRVLSSNQKNNVLQTIINLLSEFQEEILFENNKDIIKYQNALNFQKSFLDRLTLSNTRIEQMQISLQALVQEVDPVGMVQEEKILSNGLKLKKILTPLGIIFMIFESRPNVVIEAFSMAFKSGNSILLKGGKESDNTCKILYRLILLALEKNKIPSACFLGLVSPTRLETDFLIKQDRYIDVLIPRGSDKLIEYITQNTTIPLIKNERGLCHIYVHEEADNQMAIEIIDNAKTQRPGVCNAAETLLVDKKIAKEFLPNIANRLIAKKVELIVCSKSLALIPVSKYVIPSQELDYDTEYLDLKLNIKIVENVDEAIEHIEIHGSHHSECIVTNNANIAKRFQNEIDAAVVYWNASTRFTDGFEFGLGGEIGISTQKLQVRGPVGLNALTSARWIIDGKGQVRS